MRKLLLLLMLALSLTGSAQSLLHRGKMLAISSLPETLLSQTRSVFREAATEDTIITSIPEGTKKTYYMSRTIYDRFLGLCPQALKPVTFTFCENNDVYIPNMVQDVFTNEVYNGVYVKGKLSKDGTTITIPNKQKLFDKNGTQLFLCVCDTNGLAGDTVSNTFFTEPIVLKIGNNGTITPSNKEQLLGICLSPGAPAGFTIIDNYVPQDSVDSKIKKMNYNFTYTSDNNKEGKSIVSTYESGNSLYIRGFVPKYPDAWVQLLKVKSDTLAAVGFQIIDESYYLGNTFFFPAFKTKSYVGKDTISLANYILLSQNETTGEIKSLDNLLITTVYYDNSNILRAPQQYTNLDLTPANMSIAKPATPTALEFRVGYYTMMRATLPETDVNGNALDLSDAYYRVYINGNPYTFRKSDYPKLTSESDMELIPWQYDDYDDISKSGTSRYIYFSGLSADTVKTVGIETVYKVGDQVSISDRLVYDVVSKETSVVSTGIKAFFSENKTNVKPVSIFGLTGEKRTTLRHGINIVRMSDGSVRKVLLK